MRRAIRSLLLVLGTVFGVTLWFVVAVGPASAATLLTIPYISQYTGATTQNNDCGPASVAMVLDAYGKRPAGWSNRQFVEDLRRITGVSGNTNFVHLERAIAAYGLSSERISNQIAPQPDAQMQIMRNAIAQGRPVIALVNGPSLGRGDRYGDHWVVVRGFSDDGQWVYLNDPDDQASRWSGWIRGGTITLAYGTFRTAAYNAAPGPYGLIVGSGLRLATPTGLAITGQSASSLTLGWRPVSGADGYRVYRWGSQNGRWDFYLLATVTGNGNTSYTQGNLPCGNSFNYYLVTAYNRNGESPRSSWVQGATSACINQPPATPTGLAITGQSASSLTLGWRPVSGADGYRVYRWDYQNGRWDFYLLATVTGNGNTSYTQGNLPCGNSFNYYLVTAYNRNGESPRSGWVQGATSACINQPPATPTGLAITGQSASSLTLGWRPVSGADGYRVYRWGSQNGRWDFYLLATVTGNGNTSYTQGNLPCGNSFNYYLVTAYNRNGESPRSGWVQGATSACLAGQQAVIEEEGPVPPAQAEEQPPVEPVEPPANPVEPPVDPVEPPPNPVEPPADPVDPPAGPVDPPAGPVDPPATEPEPATDVRLFLPLVVR